MIQKKTILIVVLGLVGLAAAVYLYSLFSSPKVVIESHKPAKAAQVNIDNLSSYLKDIHATTQTEKNIRERVYQYLKESGVTQLNSVTGVVREGSYKSTVDGSIISVEFLVDFPAIERSYKVTAGRDSRDNIATSYILCPTLNEIVYQPSGCKDSQSE